MTGASGEDKRTPREASESDWFFDELMTAQPEATQEFFRARLLEPARRAWDPASRRAKPSR